MNKTITEEKQIDQLLSRGVEQILPDRKSFEKLLMSGKRIKIYQGFDPSSDKLHVGNAIGMKMLERFRSLGHHVIFLIGTGTGKIGDPTDKLATRKVLTDDQINKNIEKWKEQANQILDFDNKENPVEIVKNGDWLNSLSLDEFLNIGTKVTLQQLLERDMFQKRLEEHKPISISEMLYPLLQGYDSVVMEVDAEFGGNDQLFNMMMGRTLLKEMKSKEKFVITGKLIADTHGVKMGKSLGNVINLTDKPEDIYGKVMSFTDGMIESAFEILTDVPMDEVKQMGKDIESGKVNPMQYKKRLAFETTRWIKGEEKAQEAQDFFENTVQKQETPDSIPEVNNEELKSNLLIDILEQNKLVTSRGEAKRLIKQGGVEINEEKISDPQMKIELTSLPITIKCGKRKWLKII